jgi:hypothetical protein
LTSNTSLTVRNTAIWDPHTELDGGFKQTEKEKAVLKGKYWLPDVVETEPALKLPANPRRKSRYAADFEKDE